MLSGERQEQRKTSKRFGFQPLTHNFTLTFQTIIKSSGTVLCKTFADFLVVNCFDIFLGCIFTLTCSIFGPKLADELSTGGRLCRILTLARNMSKEYTYYCTLIVVPNFSVGQSYLDV